MSKWWALVAICLGTFLLLVDATIVNVALPSVAQNLDASFTAFQWVVNIYALPLAALLLIAGALADRYGRRMLFVAALAVFGLASLICGLAPSVEVLIIGRAVQGVGGAVMYATSTALIATNYHGRDMGTAFGVWAAVNGASAAVGPILGGVLTQYAGWRWIFLVNVPVALVAMLLAQRFIQESKNAAGAKLDVGGMVTFTAFVGALTFALTHSSEAGWTAPLSLGAFAVSAVSLLVFLTVERSHSRPMLDLDVLRSGSFVALMIGVLVMQGAAFSRLPYALDWLQSTLGLGPMAAGLVGSVPLSAAVFVVALLTGKFLQHLNARIPVGIGLLLLAAGLFLQVNLTADSGGAALVAGLLVSGIGVGMINPVLTSAAIAALPKAKAGIAGGVVNTFRQLGFAIGIALFGAVFANRVTGSLTQGGQFSQGQAATIMHGGGIDAVLAAAPAGQRDLLAHAVRGAFASGVNQIHLIAGIAAAVSAVLVFLLVGRRATAEEQPSAPTPTATGGSVR